MHVCDLYFILQSFILSENLFVAVFQRIKPVSVKQTSSPIDLNESTVVAKTPSTTAAPIKPETPSVEPSSSKLYSIGSFNINILAA